VKHADRPTRSTYQTLQSTSRTSLAKFIIKIYEFRDVISTSSIKLDSMFSIYEFSHCALFFNKANIA